MPRIPEDPEVLLKYGDIIGLEPPVSLKQPKMTGLKRAAQFSPFAALTGYEDEVKEAARLTEDRTELVEDMRLEIGEKLRFLSEHLFLRPEVTAVYFRPDALKAGGSYESKTGIVKKADGYVGKLVFTDGGAVPFQDLISLAGAVFDGMETGEGYRDP